jgi:protein SCO1
MRADSRSALTLLAIPCIMAAAACGAPPEPALPLYGDTTLTPTWPSPRQRAAAHRVGAFALVDQRGRTITADSLAGQTYVAHFFFARCGDICPITRGRLLAVQQQFLHDPRVRLVSISMAGDALDPTDSLSAYGQRHGIDPDRWLLLTGQRDTVATLARHHFVVGLGRDAEYGGRDIAHTELVVLVDGDGHIRGVYNGMLELETRQLATDIVALLAERH